MPMVNHSIMHKLTSDEIKIRGENGFHEISGRGNGFHEIWGEGKIGFVRSVRTGKWASAIRLVGGGKLSL